MGPLVLGLLGNDRIFMKEIFGYISNSSIFNIVNVEVSKHKRVYLDYPMFLLMNVMRRSRVGFFINYVVLTRYYIRKLLAFDIHNKSQEC